MPELNQDVKNIAERIVSYETREKGAVGRLFAFEARDGFWSKLAKTLGLASATVGSGYIAFLGVSSLVAGPVGLFAAGIAAAAAGLVSGAITRAVNQSVFSDLHSSHKNSLGKFGHYIGIGLVSGAVGSIFANALLPGLGIAAASAASLAYTVIVTPLIETLTSRGIASGFGDQQLRMESEQAKVIAAQAIQSGQSVEQLLTQGKPNTQVSHDTLQESYEPTPEKTRNFTKMIEEQRANSQNISIA